MEKGDLLIKIDAYLCGHLSEAEEKALEQSIASDSTLEKRVEQQKKHLEALEVLVEDDLRSKMQIWENEKKDEIFSKKSQLLGWVILTIALCSGLYFLLKPKNDITTIINLNQDTIKKDSLNAPVNQQSKTAVDTLNLKIISPTKHPNNTPSFPKPKTQNKLQPIVKNTNLPKDLLDSSKAEMLVMLSEIDMQIVRDNKNPNNTLFESYQFIKNKDYKTAIKILKDFSNTEGVFMLAMTYFLDGEYSQAQALFDSLAQNKGYYQSETVEYFAAVCTWANKQNVEAIQRFNDIANDGKHQFNIKAKKALDRLRE